MNLRRVFLLKSLSLGLLATGCTPFSGNRETDAAANSVAVLGVVQRQGLKIPLNEYRLAGDLEDLLRDNHNYAVMAVDQVRLSLGSQRHDLLLRRLARSGSLDETDLRMLRQANLPTKTGVLLTITGNESAKLDPERLRLRDNRGDYLNDREQVVLSTARRVSLIATVVNLGAERVQLHNEFTYSAIERKQFLEYSGANFGSSMAARLANTFSNGIRPPDWPDAPNLHNSFYELLSDVAEKLPIA